MDRENPSANDALRRKLLDEASELEDHVESKKNIHSIHEKQSFDSIFFRRLWRIAKLCHRHLFDWLWIFALILIVAAQLVVGSFVGDANKGFYDAFSTVDPAAFRSTLALASCVVIGSAILETLTKVFASILAWRWRRSIVQRLHQKYFEARMFYKLLNFDERIDNPDQRITQDVDNLTTTLSQVLGDILSGPMTIGYYTYQTWVSIGWYAPAIVLCYFIISMFLNKLIMSPIVNRVFRQERLEGDFRYAHVRVRTNAEAIALYGGEFVEQEHVNKRFMRALSNSSTLIKWDFLLLLTTNFFSYFGSMVNFMILAIPLLNGWPLNIHSGGAVALASFQVIMLISGFSKFNNVSQKVSDLAGYTSRVGQLFDVIEQLAAYQPDKSVYNGVITDSNVSFVPSSITGGVVQETTSPAIEFDNVTLWTPRGRRLMKSIKFQVREGQSLLVMGPSGCGKSTILRTLCGLWPFFSGTVRRPPMNRKSPQHVLFLAQTPFLTSGTLRDQIVYPGDFSKVSLSDTRLEEILTILGMRYLLDQPNGSNVDYAPGDSRISLKRRSNREWIELLSPGEQQRLCMARVLFWQPRFVFLDEATSAVDYEIEKRFYTACRQMGCCFVSVGHSDTLKRYHDLILRLDHTHKWTISDLNPESL